MKNQQNIEVATTTVNEMLNRPHTPFLVKPMYEGKSHPCNEYHFDLTCHQSRRVKKLEEMRLGQLDHTVEEYYLLRGRQPLFYFQERFAADCAGYDWNGLLLYSVRGNIEDARKVALAHQKELHIVLAFTDPHLDRYFLLIDTQTGGGTEHDHDQWAEDLLDTQVCHYFFKARSQPLSTYCNALRPEYYDIIDRDTLFGQADIHSPQPEASRCAQTMTVGQIIRQFFGHLVNH